MTQDYAEGVDTVEPEDGIEEGYEVFGIPVPLGVKRETMLRVQSDFCMWTRHWLIAGATGVGKTATVREMVEFCAMNGVPSIVADGKGDMSGLALPGSMTEKQKALMARTDQEEWWAPTTVPVELLSPGGNGAGVPVKAMVQDFGYRMLAKLLGLTQPQTNALGAAFLMADKEGFTLESLEDMERYIRIKRDDPDSAVAPSVCTRILDRLALFGADNAGLFGGPDFDVMDLLRVDSDGWGTVSIADMSELRDIPDVFTTFLLWILQKLLKTLPEVGDQEKPRVVFFFDEAHLMFEGATREFVQQVESFIKRCRSKGIAIVFISQTGGDIPQKILRQVGNRIQFACRANTPQELRELKKGADTFPMSEYDTLAEFTSMPTGTALVALLDDNGVPTPPAVTYMYSPRTSIAPMTQEQIEAHVRRSALGEKYRRLEEARLEAILMASRPPQPVARVREAGTGLAGAVRGLRSRLGGSGAPVEPEPAVTDPWA